MDKAIVGEARAGYTKAGVQNLDWPKILAQFENVSVQVDLRAGYAKADVKRDEWAKTLATFENISTPKKLLLDQGIAKLDVDVGRLDVFTSHFNDLIKRFEEAS